MSCTARSEAGCAMDAGQADSTPPDVAPALGRAWTGSGDAATASAALLPVRLTRACVEVLGVAGAGLSLHQGAFRVPVGGSDEMATLAERLQFTHGDGPCLDAAAHHRVLIADAAELHNRWPAFTEELFRHTPYRAIISLPLATGQRPFAALDLYLIDAAALRTLALHEVYQVSQQTADAAPRPPWPRQGLSRSTKQPPAARPPGGPTARTPPPADPSEPLTPPDNAVPAWLDAAPAHTRSQVWVAMGMAMTEFHLTATDALALLRSYAYGHDRLLDDVAADLVHRRTDLAEMQP